jgi:hypothetical protein
MKVRDTMRKLAIFGCLVVVALVAGIVSVRADAPSADCGCVYATERATRG